MPKILEMSAAVTVNAVSEFGDKKKTINTTEDLKENPSED